MAAVFPLHGALEGMTIGASIGGGQGFGQQQRQEQALQRRQPDRISGAHLRLRTDQRAAFDAAVRATPMIAAAIASAAWPTAPALCFHL